MVKQFQQQQQKIIRFAGFVKAIQKDERFLGLKYTAPVIKESVEDLDEIISSSVNDLLKCVYDLPVDDDSRIVVMKQSLLNPKLSAEAKKRTQVSITAFENVIRQERVDEVTQIWEQMQNVDDQVIDESTEESNETQLTDEHNISQITIVNAVYGIIDIESDEQIIEFSEEVSEIINNESKPIEEVPVSAVKNINIVTPTLTTMVYSKFVITSETDEQVKFVSVDKRQEFKWRQQHAAWKQSTDFSIPDGQSVNKYIPAELLEPVDQCGRQFDIQFLMQLDEYQAQQDHAKLTEQHLSYYYSYMIAKYELKNRSAIVSLKEFVAICIQQKEKYQKKIDRHCKKCETEIQKLDERILKYMGREIDMVAKNAFEKKRDARIVKLQQNLETKKTQYAEKNEKITEQRLRERQIDRQQKYIKAFEQKIEREREYQYSQDDKYMVRCLTEKKEALDRKRRGFIGGPEDFDLADVVIAPLEKLHKKVVVKSQKELAKMIKLIENPPKVNYLKFNRINEKLIADAEALIASCDGNIPAHYKYLIKKIPAPSKKPRVVKPKPSQEGVPATQAPKIKTPRTKKAVTPKKVVGQPVQ